jgi:hypothetical protein
MKCKHIAITWLWYLHLSYIDDQQGDSRAAAGFLIVHIEYIVKIPKIIWYF